MFSNRKFSINRHTGVPKPRRFSVGEVGGNGKNENLPFLISLQIPLSHPNNTYLLDLSWLQPSYTDTHKGWEKSLLSSFGVECGVGAEQSCPSFSTQLQLKLDVILGFPIGVIGHDNFTSRKN